MLKKSAYVCFNVLLVACLSGCIGTVWTGASAIYDRHAMYIKLNDYHLLREINDVLAVNKTFQQLDCVIDIAVFKGDVLLAGHLPSAELMDEFRLRINKVKGYRRLFIEMTIKQANSNSIQDSWITAKIRSQILADASIDPNAFKIVTSDTKVYLMGDVHPDQAEKVITIARKVSGVSAVVKLMRYFTYQEKM